MTKLKEKVWKDFSERGIFPACVGVIRSRKVTMESNPLAGASNVHLSSSLSQLNAENPLACVR